MSDRFFDRPILNSPYEYPSRHWEPDDSGQSTSQILDHRRSVSFINPIPKPKKRGQRTLALGDETKALEADGQQYELMGVIYELRRRIDAWRVIPDTSQWRVIPETARLIQHWRSHDSGDIRPFFCQVEAAVWRDLGEEPRLHLLGQLRRITRQWLKYHAVCKGGTYPDSGTLTHGQC